MSTTDPGAPIDVAPSHEPKRFRVPREGVMVTGSLFSGGTLGWALSLVVAQLPPPWKDTLNELVPAATTAISALVYLASSAVRSYWGPKRFRRDKEAVIRKCDDRLQSLLRLKAEIQKGRSPTKQENLKRVCDAIDDTERRKVLAEIAEYPERLWEGRLPVALVPKPKGEAAE